VCLRHDGVMTTTSHLGITNQGNLATRKSTFWADFRDLYRDRRTARAQFHRIERELATYTTPSDLAELDALIERSDIGSDTADTAMIERIRLRAA
jgi:hypothetical protein